MSKNVSGIKKSFSILVLLFLSIWGFQNCSNVDFAQSNQSKSLGSTYDPKLPDPPICQKTTAQGVVPKLKWDWYAQLDKTDPALFPTMNQVMSTPMVADLNGDTYPEVVFINFSVQSQDWFSDTISSSSYNKNGVLRIVDGRTGVTLHSIGSPELAPFGSMSPLLVDLNQDGKIEIIYLHYTMSKMIALNHDGTHRWSFEVSHGAIHEGLAAGDFNKDGRSDIILDQVVVTENSNGEPVELFSIAATRLGLSNMAYSLNPALPNELQIIGRDGVFDHEGRRLFDLSGVRYFAPADVDPNVDGIEIVTSGSESLKIVSGVDGTVLKSLDLGPLNELKCPRGNVGGGPPTIGDFDGVPETIEIAIATGRFLSIFTQDLQLMTKYETQDCSSLVTGISSFDFNGDGKPEILYADEEYFRIFEIENGELKVVSKIVNPSGTLVEYPIVVDVDRNGASEIILAANNYPVTSFYRDPGEEVDQAAAYGITGVRAFEATEVGSWMPTGSIWHQFNFNPGLVSSQGIAMSRTPFIQESYTAKNFRRNSQLGLFEPRCVEK